MTHRGPSFASPTRPVIVDAPQALLDLSRAQAPHWPESDAAAGNAVRVTATTAPDGNVRFTAGSYEAPDVVLPPGLLAANGLIGTVIGAFVAADADWICLHGAALAMGPGGQGGLTVLLGDTMAGKSTLAMALTARGAKTGGARLWCDDRLPLSADAMGFALGLCPKLRLPLPDSAPASFMNLVDGHETAREGSMVYLGLGDRLQAVFGERLKVARLIVLARSRQPQVPVLTGASVATTVKHLVPVTFAPHLDPMARLGRLRQLAEASECLHLSYGDSFAAAALLMKGADA